jgi:hypothetical protein
VRQAWEQIDETVLQHQGTLYPATAAAAPFLCQIALDEATPWRAALTADLAFLSTGCDEPYAPAGTAQAPAEAPAITAQLAGWFSTAMKTLRIPTTGASGAPEATAEAA